MRQPLVLSKLNLKCANRRVFMLDQQAPVLRLDKAIVLLMALYTNQPTCACTCVTVLYLAHVPTFTGCQRGGS